MRLSPPRSQSFLKTCCLLATLTALAVLLCGPAQALPRIEKIVTVTATPAALNLGTTAGVGQYDSAAELKVHVAANCLHGGIIASVTPLTRSAGSVIGPERVFVRLPLTGAYVPMTHPLDLTGPMNPGVFDVILKFRVETTWGDDPGQYAGTMTITCSVAP